MQRSILDGHLYQLNYGRRWHGTLGASAARLWDVMRGLVAANPAPFGGWLMVPDQASPSPVASFP